MSVAPTPLAPLLYVLAARAAVVAKRTAWWKLMPDAMVSAYVLLTMSVPLVGAVVMVPVVSAIDVMSVFAPNAAALRLVRAAPALLALVPPLAKGSMPVTCVVRSTPESVPPSVSDPDDVTVPVSVMPLTVPVPPTEVTVPTY